jgi:hypothetical protein
MLSFTGATDKPDMAVKWTGEYQREYSRQQYRLHKDTIKKYYLKRRPYFLQYKKEYYQRNREIMREYDRQYRQLNRERKKAYYLQRRDHFLDYKHTYYQRNREYMRLKQRINYRIKRYGLYHAVCIMMASLVCRPGT